MWASQPGTYLSWIPWMWNATSHHGGGRVSPGTYLTACMPMYTQVYPSTQPSVYLPMYLSTKQASISHGFQKCETQRSTRVTTGGLGGSTPYKKSPMQQAL